LNFGYMGVHVCEDVHFLRFIANLNDVNDGEIIRRGWRRR
jgi:hypothetical protein